MNQTLIQTPDPLWVFGYGSLMWNPGFVYERSCSALLKGYHRDFCIYSHHYRGTPEHPGLVLGLDQGGTCQGVAFLVAPENHEATINYLNERELTGYTYQPKTLALNLGNETVMSYTFVADAHHGLYAGDLGLEVSARLIMEASGVNGLNRDYLINTIQHLEGVGFREDNLHTLYDKVKNLTGVIDQGSGI